MPRLTTRLHALTVRRRFLTTLVAAGAIAGLAAVPATAALASGAPTTAHAAAGTIRYYEVSTRANSTVNKGMVVGAFADHGTDHDNANGNPNRSKIELTKGTFEVNTKKINKITNSSTFGTFDAASCSFFGTAKAPVSLLDGTGAYAGIKGTLQATVTIAGILPRRANGNCNTSNNANLVAATFVVEATGKVSF
jgi:hypothetical protein